MPIPPDPIPDLTGAIADVAANPASVTAGDRTITEQSLADLIEADRYLAGKRAVAGGNAAGGSRSGWGALRPAKVVMPGAV